MSPLTQIFDRVKDRMDVWREIPFSPNVHFTQDYIFIHVPKTAGTSMAAALGQRKSNHYKARYYREKIGKRYDRMFKFCIVRNPWDRFLSTYDYIRMPENYHHSAIQPEKARHGKHVDYDLVSKLSLVECARLLVQGAFRHSKSSHWWPQFHWFTDMQGKTIVDYIGRYEELPRAVEHISRVIQVDIHLPYLNKSRFNSLSYRERMDAETVELVGQYYAQDIRLLGYSF